MPNYYYCIILLVIMYVHINTLSAIELSRCVCSELCSMLQHEVVSSYGDRVCVYLGAVVAALILLSYVCYQGYLQCL